MNISKNLEIIENNDKVFLYNRITGDNLRANKNIMSLINAISAGESVDCFSGIVKVLEEKKFVVTDEKIDRQFEYDMDEVQNGKLIQNLRLILTEKCNLNCEYCYEKVSNEYIKRRTMHWETAKVAIDLFFSVLRENKREIANIRFFGGEPLIEFNLMMKCIKYINENFSDIKQKNYILNTNGTLISKERAVKLKEQEVLVIISIDGTKDYHDLQRKYLSNKGSFDDVDKSIDILAAEGCRIAVTNVCTNNNYYHLHELVDYIDSKNKKYESNIKLSFNNIHICSRKGVIDLDYGERKRLLLEAIKYGRNKSIDTTGGLTYLIFNNMLHGNNGHHCAGNGHELSINPNGDVYTCSGVEVKMGNILEGKTILQNDNYLNAAMRQFAKLEECKECSIACYCGGGCYAEYLSEDGKEKETMRDCEFERMMFVELVKEYVL